MESRRRPEDAAIDEQATVPRRRSPVAAPPGEPLPRGELPQGRVAAVVPAAGSSERMGGETPKQYMEVCGRPLVIYCLEALQKVAWVSQVVVVADDLARMTGVVRAAGLTKVKVVHGGGSRHRSIRVGVEALAAEDEPPDVVVVHDGARPLVPPDTLAQVAVMAERHGAAGAVRPLVSTVVMPDPDDFLQESLVRSLYRNSEMPQAFRLDVLREAYRRCSDEEADHGTECLALALRHAGAKAKLVPGTAHLWKVTEEKDLEVARILLPRLTRTTSLVCRTLASHAHHTAQAAPSSSVRPLNDPLMCSEECARVFALLDGAIREYCKELVFSCSYDAPVPSPASLISITNATTIDTLPEHIKTAAANINKAIGPVTLLVTLQGQSSQCLPPTIASLQQVLREAFSDHSGPVTVILRGSGKVPKGGEQGQGVIEGHPPATVPDSPPPDADRLRCLVTSLLDQKSRGFHGLVLVV
ncbi:D-ribitol-5-phosphate cytidylyltransferase-like isoform X2 [Eriocheir sinensis]|uniref:D-ribitol-5-phosphate cytidylyltransferase-like isoform X2 n=1 Tax=Eriocheir sinensis TaxID=95602 RepID=UPI0021C7F8FC|nr:D-ribitol-5-phosphate cytidylyltransferase-like isoform X2 [Eriocheir sinensis]